MTEFNLEKTCRICLKHNAVLNIYTHSTKVSCSDMFDKVFCISNWIKCWERCTDSRKFDEVVHESDELPKKLCRKCFNKLSSAYELMQLGVESHKVLLRYFCKEPIKNNLNEDDIKIEYETLDNAILNIHEFSDSLKSTSEFEMKRSNAMESLEIIKLETELNETIDDEEEINYSSDLDNEENIPICIENNIFHRNLTKVKKARKLKGTKQEQGKENIEKRKSLVMCDLCGKQVLNMTDHRILHLPPEEKKKFLCHQCPKVFSQPGSRNRHYRIHHLGKIYYCIICDKHVKHKTEHIRQCHFPSSSQPPQYECPQCNKMFHTAARMRQHQKLHKRERNFPCPVCGKLFISPSQASYHRRSIHEKEKQYICQICSMGFFFNSELNKHMRRHSSERNFKCPECDKTFKQANALRMHLVRHAGLRKHHCQICKKTCITAGDLKSHMLTHTKERTYPCKYCGVKFGRSDHRNRHQKTAHENVHSSDATK